MALRAATIAVLLCCAAFGLVACGPDGQVTERPSPPDETRAVSEETAEGTAPDPPRAPPPERTTPEEPGTDLARLLAEEGDGDAGAYRTVADGALTVEVPVGWEHEAGNDPDIGGVWSQFGGEGSEPSITAATDVAGWYVNEPVKGADVVASRDMARYTDYQLVASGGNELSLCEPGASSDYRRGTYSGRMQAWGGCLGDPDISAVSLSAAPEGRECVVVLHVLMLGEEDVEAGQHVLDTFEVDCGAVPSDPPVAATADDQYAPEQYAEGSEPSPSGVTSGPLKEYEPQYEPNPSPSPSPDPDTGSGYPPFPGDPYDGPTCDEVGGGPYSVPPGSPRDSDGDGVACE